MLETFETKKWPDLFVSYTFIRIKSVDKYSHRSEPFRFAVSFSMSCSSMPSVVIHSQFTCIYMNEHISEICIHFVVVDLHNICVFFLRIYNLFFINFLCSCCYLISKSSVVMDFSIDQFRRTEFICKS